LYCIPRRLTECSYQNRAAAAATNPRKLTSRFKLPLAAAKPAAAKFGSRLGATRRPIGRGPWVDRTNCEVARILCMALDLDRCKEAALVVVSLSAAT
jgi:hypothetical protein